MTQFIERGATELFQSFWPKVAEHPTSEEWTDAQRELSQAGKSVRGIVVSDTLRAIGRMSASLGVERPISNWPNSNARRAKRF